MATAIKVVLQKGVDNLGSGGEIVRVRPGFARNYLIPRGLALPATKGNLARVEELKKLAADEAARELAAAQEVKVKLESISVKISRSVGEEGKMYGSVTGKDVEDAYRAEGIEIDRRKLDLKDPIKELGLVELPLKLHKSVVAQLRVEVIKG